MEDSGENFDAIDNARSWPRKVRTGIDQINLASARCGK
jgi:hypothetical protein